MVNSLLAECSSTPATAPAVSPMMLHTRLIGGMTLTRYKHGQLVSRQHPRPNHRQHMDARQIKLCPAPSFSTEELTRRGDRTG